MGGDGDGNGELSQNTGKEFQPQKTRVKREGPRDILPGREASPRI